MKEKGKGFSKGLFFSQIPIKTFYRKGSRSKYLRFMIESCLKLNRTLTVV
jgi:hypothetical protein